VLKEEKERVGNGRRRMFEPGVEHLHDGRNEAPLRRRLLHLPFQGAQRCCRAFARLESADVVEQKLPRLLLIPHLEAAADLLFSRVV
jgi:hypothetical protein